MRNKKSLDFFGIQAKILGLQRYLVMRLRESRFKHGEHGNRPAGGTETTEVWSMLRMAQTGLF